MFGDSIQEAFSNARKSAIAEKAAYFHYLYQLNNQSAFDDSKVIYNHFDFYRDLITEAINDERISVITFIEILKRI